jgi:DNA-binding SARP family transcriptional activator
MGNKESELDAVIVDAEIGCGRQTQFDDGQWSASRAKDARRIAELEQKVRELRRANEILKVYLTGELELGLRLPGTGAGITSDRNNVNVEVSVPSRSTTPDAARRTTAPPPDLPGSPRPRAEFRALGPIEAVVDGRPVDLGAPKQRALLALLVSQVGQPVATDMIVEELWTGRPPPSAITSLQAYVANLRRVLEPDRVPRRPTTVLRTCGRGYLLDARVVEVDVHRFEEHVASGLRALDCGHPQQALSEFDSGLALWRGQAYAEVANATCVVPGVVRLEELRLSVVEGRCAALLGVGAHEVAVAELEAFTQSHPLREYGYELLSLALYRAGRQADALAALRTNQKRLAEELGIDPRPTLQRLEREILNQAPALDWQPVPRSPRWTGN